MIEATPRGQHPRYLIHYHDRATAPSSRPETTPLRAAERGAIGFPALGSPPATGYRLTLPTKMSVLPKVPAHCAGTLGRGPVPARNASTAAQAVAARASVQTNQAC